MSGPLQVEFFFSGPPLSADSQRTDYAGFNLNGVEYKLGDCAYLYPEDEGVPPYVGRILACFQDRSGTAADPHCVEVAWYERRAHLEPEPLGATWDREVVALEEADINPIGCISGKAVVLRAGDYEEASQMAMALAVEDWLFCRGSYNQNCFVPFPELAEQLDFAHGKQHGKRSQTGLAGHAEGVADSDEVKRQRIAEEQPVAPVRRTGKLVSGRTCVECGATQTPQWREGPAGPKTLCNACGVRYVRAQQRANKRSVPIGAPRGGNGSGGRQSRTSKAAKAEAASARASRGAAAAAAVAATAGPAEEALQRPQRQAALMAASKTAQYARTGIFPLTATELEAPDSASAQAFTPQQLHPLQDQQQAADAGGTAESYGVPTAAAAAAAIAGGAAFRPDTPNCSSYDSCGSLQEGMTVEVVVGPADGDAEYCGSREVTATAADAPLVASASTAAAVGPSFQLLPSSAGLRLPSQFAGGMEIMVSAEQPLLALAPVAAQGGDQHQMLPAQALIAAAGPACEAGALRSSSDFAVGCGTPPPAMLFASAVPEVGLGGEGAFHQLGRQQLSGFGSSQVAVGCEASAHSGGRGGAAAGDCSTGCVPPITVESCTAQVVSAPVSPSVRGDDGFDCCGFAADGRLDGELQLHGYSSQLACGLAAGLDDEYGPLVEVEMDFGLGPATALGDGSLFAEFRACDGGEEDDEVGHPQPPQVHTGQLQPQQHQDSDDPAISVEDLPAVAARVAAYCPDLAPGSDAHTLLNSVYVLAQTTGARSACDSSAIPAAPAGTVMGAVAADAADGSAGAALPGEAVARLVALGRQASRAATEAMAADAAVHAVNQVLEAHQEAARRAREAAVANLGRLKECITAISGGDSSAAVEMSGHLVDLHDLGVGGSLLQDAPAGCCFDSADLVVAVHS